MKPWDNPSPASSLRAFMGPGIYFLIRHGEVVYVGQSTCVIARVADHARKGLLDFDSFASEDCPCDELDAVEQRYIAELLPEYNTCAISQRLRKRYMTAEEYRETPRYGTCPTPIRELANAA